MDIEQARRDENLGPLFVGLTSVLTILSFCTLLVRWTVRLSRRNPWWDDYAITLTIALAVARTAIQVATVRHGNGRHYEFLTPPQQWTISKLGYFTQLTWFPASGLIKVSICLLVLRIKSTKVLRRMLYPIMLGAILLNAMPWIVLLSECKPIRAHWDYEAGTCWQSRSKTYIIYASIGYNVTTDLICASLPVIAVWNLHLKRSRKLLIYGLVLLGLIATGCAVGRATALSLDPMDYTWTYCIAALWSNFELHISIISVNSTAFPAFIVLLRDRLKSSKRSPRGRPVFDNGHDSFRHISHPANMSVTCRRGSSSPSLDLILPRFHSGNKPKDMGILVTQSFEHEVELGERSSSQADSIEPLPKKPERSYSSSSSKTVVAD